MGSKGFSAGIWYRAGWWISPDVSPYRLAAHLGLAVAIYGCLIWVALGLLMGDTIERVCHQASRWRGLAVWGATGLVFLTIISGAFVAGNDAGLAYNTFPLMAEAIVPPDIFLIEPLWRNFFETVPLVQLDHRLLAMLTALVVILLWAAALRWLGSDARRESRFMQRQATVLGQFVLGIATLLTFVPVPLGAAHQLGAMAVFTAILVALRLLYPARTAPPPVADFRPLTKRLISRGMKPIRPRTARPSRAF